MLPIVFLTIRTPMIAGEMRLSFKEALQRRFGGGGELIGHGDVGPEIPGSLPVFWEIGMGSAALSVDKDTGEARLPHRIDLKTGKYKGRKIIDVKVSE